MDLARLSLIVHERSGLTTIQFNIKQALSVTDNDTQKATLGEIEKAVETVKKTTNEFITNIEKSVSTIGIPLVEQSNLIGESALSFERNMIVILNKSYPIARDLFSHIQSKLKNSIAFSKGSLSRK